MPAATKGLSVRCTLVRASWHVWALQESIKVPTSFENLKNSYLLGTTKFFIQLRQLLKSAVAELSPLGNTVQKRFYLTITSVSVTELLKHWNFLGYRNVFSYPFQGFMLLRWLLVGLGKFSNERWHSGGKGQELWATRLWAEGWKSSFTISGK